MSIPTFVLVLGVFAAVIVVAVILAVAIDGIERLIRRY